jgi:hypothetical protein
MTNEQKDPEPEKTNQTGSWLAIGAGLGVALGVVMDNIGLGIAIGVAIGLAIGAGQAQQQHPKE